MEAGPRNRAQQPDGGTDPAPLTDDGPDAEDGLPGAAPDPGTLDDSDAPDSGADGPGEGGESFRELRPPRRLRLWQLAPIVALAVLGSLMFAFPLAFELGGDGGAMIAMLGLLLCCCAAGWGMMAARRVGHTWPGLPVPGSGRRADWRVVLLYALVVAVPASLAIWRVARLR
ncbi:hypothetical protein SAMN05428945_7107 [Streptomyces sp. 2224.1]|uniref:hypothetical protein n=1 Tax=unclassified Streptomyces TaxID=2593676 RepID=UPI00088AB0EF|nr:MULTISPECIES: hypothetical protein [unclassified Streptomyces]PBC85469.1 hypothetical protein BX261_5483 [Streptomyces sp. 2321.6]SDR14293.1 hypothetical protein SAMN05216511_1779 [Streptomyces sp. KS_16]SED69038.1 hypothetical protein SAMN05428940_5509 [Streptomyces sp. 2133.1]SEE13208.1 hypothetical protein SAMN05428954_1855 [Streptomyces sp. 2112.3]SEE33252.1 hypothetical protein SAMN05428945_7107 [Streptomyces sp. 2224.1]